MNVRREYWITLLIFGDYRKIDKFYCNLKEKKKLSTLYYLYIFTRSFLWMQKWVFGVKFTNTICGIFIIFVLWFFLKTVSTICKYYLDIVVIIFFLFSERNHLYFSYYCKFSFALQMFEIKKSKDTAQWKSWLIFLVLRCDVEEFSFFYSGIPQKWCLNFRHGY